MAIMLLHHNKLHFMHLSNAQIHHESLYFGHLENQNALIRSMHINIMFTPIKIISKWCNQSAIGYTPY